MQICTLDFPVSGGPKTTDGPTNLGQLSCAQDAQPMSERTHTECIARAHVKLLCIPEDCSEASVSSARLGTARSACFRGRRPILTACTVLVGPFDHSAKTSVDGFAATPEGVVIFDDFISQAGRLNKPRCPAARKRRLNEFHAYVAEEQSSSCQQHTRAVWRFSLPAAVGLITAVGRADEGLPDPSRAVAAALISDLATVPAKTRTVREARSAFEHAGGRGGARNGRSKRGSVGGD
jgi:hypothetical protein